MGSNIQAVLSFALYRFIREMVRLQCIPAVLLLASTTAAAAAADAAIALSHLDKPQYVADSNLLTAKRDSMINGATPDCTSSASSSRYQPLVCWLYKAKLNLPDESFQEGMFPVVSTIMICF